MNNREMLVNIWCDLNPFRKEFGNLNHNDIMASATQRGYPQTSLELAKILLNIKVNYNSKLNWGVASCEPYFEWINYVSSFLETTRQTGDAITIIPYWMKYEDNYWIKSKNPTVDQVFNSLKPVNVLSKYQNYVNIVRSGWYSQKLVDNSLLRNEYLKYCFSGTSDIIKTNCEYVIENNFLILPFDCNSTDNCVLNYKNSFSRAIYRAMAGGSVFNWIFDISDMTPQVFDHILSWSEETAHKNNIKLNYVNLIDLKNILR